MFVPYITEPHLLPRNLFRRKGGGKSSSSSSRSSSSKSSSSSGGKAGKSSYTSSSSSSWGYSSKSKYKSISSSSSSSGSWYKTKSSTTYGNPIVPVAAAIPAGNYFAGRMAGGATRAQIFGTRTYGSGYPGVTGRGTAGRGFPYIFWPIAWPLTVGGGVASAAYLHNNFEYGDPTNTTRPGGPLSYAIFTSPSSPPTTFRLLSDNTTTLSLLEDISKNCTALLSPSSPSQIVPYTTRAFLPPYEPPDTPQPEQVVQYFRASTIALSLDGYNNSATYSSDEGVADASLPTMSEGDLKLLECLNQTIGLAAPLVSGSMRTLGIDGMGDGGLFGAVGLLSLVWVLLFA